MHSAKHAGSNLHPTLKHFKGHAIVFLMVKYKLSDKPASICLGVNGLSVAISVK